MKKVTLIVAAVVVLVLVVPASASAGGRVTVHRLRRELRNMTVLRDRERAELVASRAQAATLTGRAAALEGQLATVTAQRDAARAQAAALQAQLAAVPAPLDVAVRQVNRMVAWATRGTAGSTWALHGPSTLPRGELVSLAAMDYVLGHVSPAAYGYLEVTGGMLPAALPNPVLAEQAGFCGDAALTFAAIVKRFGLDARSVQFYFETPTGEADSHIAVEVAYGDGWHFYDPTFGAYWTDGTGNVVSNAEARSSSDVEHRDTAAFTNVVEDPWFAGDDVGFELDPATVVDVDAQPFVS